MVTITYPLDETGISPSNLVLREPHVLTELNDKVYRIIVPKFAPFYLDNLRVRFVENNGTVRDLVEGVDYELVLNYLSATYSIGKMLYGGIAIKTNLINGNLSINYQTLGGNWTADSNYVYEQLAELLFNPRLASWEQVSGKPEIYPPKQHNQDLEDITGYRDLIESINKITLALESNTAGSEGGFLALLKQHAEDPNHPYGLPELMTNQELSSEELHDKLMTQRQIYEWLVAKDGIIQTQNKLIELLIKKVEKLTEHVDDVELHTQSKDKVGLGQVENLPLATEEDIHAMVPVDKYVTMAQVLEMIEKSGMVIIPPTDPEVGGEGNPQYPLDWISPNPGRLFLRNSFPKSAVELYLRKCGC